jgi:hypothetical protein
MTKAAGRRAAPGTVFSAPMVFRPSLFLGLPLLALAACGTPDAVYATNFAPDFAPAHHTVSVLGVFKDGRMSSEAWDAIGARVARSLGASKCEAAYADAATSPHHALWAAIDDYTQANGPTDDLLAKIAPAALGDLVLVVIVAGKLPTPEKIKVQEENNRPQSAAGGMGGGGRGGMGTLGGMRNGGGRMFRADPGAADRLDLSASLFSVPKATSVALVALQYSGESVDDAIAKFTSKLGGTLPGAACVGWNWEANIDPDAIRLSIDR